MASCLDTKSVRHFDQWELLSLVTFRPCSSALAALGNYSPGSVNAVDPLVSVSNYYLGPVNSEWTLTWGFGSVRLRVYSTAHAVKNKTWPLLQEILAKGNNCSRNGWEWLFITSKVAIKRAWGLCKKKKKKITGHGTKTK